MFTGLIQHTQVLQSCFNQGQLIISCFASDIRLGESISINGVCLTVVQCDQQHLVFDVSPETLRVTSLGKLKQGDTVNIERAMLASDRFGGHFVQGHVDAIVRLAKLDQLSDHWHLTFDHVQPQHQPLVIEKGSVALDGVSLTVNQRSNDSFSVMLIPETQSKTNFHAHQVGNWLNIEYDLLVKTVHQRMAMAKRECS